LNRTPIFILGGVVLLVSGALGYTLYQREAAIRAKQALGSQAPAGPATAASVLANAPSGIVTPAARPQPPGAPLTAAAGQSALAGRARAVDLAGQRHAAELAQEEAELERARMQAETAALSAASSVQMAPSGATTPTATAAAVPGMPTVPPFLANGGSAGGYRARAAGTGDPNGQNEKAGFLSQPPTASDYLPNTREQAASPFEIRAGTVIPAVMVGGVDSDLPGQILGQVRENVYDTATGRYLLIPQGAKLVGTYDNRVTYGQSRVLVVWNRIIFPDGSSLDINGMPGADQGGYAGFYDQVNNHYIRIFGSALLLSLFSAGIQLSQPQPNANSNNVYSSQQIIAGAVGQQLGNAGLAFIQRGMNLAPTLKIRPGYLFNVMVTKDIVVPIYHSSAG
jgi:type IV secretion system protein VirB10